MIIDKTITIKTTNKNISHYKNLGYDIKSGEIINIPPEHLPNTCKLKINVKCDVCGNNKFLSYHSYTRNIEKYGYYTCSTKCAINKHRQTTYEKYGVNSFTQTKEYIEKTKKTKKERYGNENFVNIEKQKQTNLEKYGSETYMSTDEFRKKSKQTNLEKYGTEHPMQSDIIKNKLIDTNLEKYGTKTPLQNDNVKEKIKETKLLTYGDENYNNREKYKETMLNEYGVDNPMKNKKIKEKIINNNLEKYGVKHHMQNEEIFNKIMASGYSVHQYKNTNIYYQGTYELDFLEKYYNIINIERGKSIKYNYGDSERIYFPDFYIPEFNLIIEIKSSKWYNEHLDKNIEKKNSAIKQGYKFLFIIDKDYTVFDKLLQYKN